MASYELQKAIFIPRSVNFDCIWPFGQMSVGDTFLVAYADRARAQGAARYWRRKYGIKVSYRVEGKNYRFWRVA